MTDDKTMATKQDIQMILEAMSTMGKDIEERLERKLDEKLDEKLKIQTKELHRFMMILFEDLEERVFGMNRDRFSLHDNKLDNHEERIEVMEDRLAIA